MIETPGGSEGVHCSVCDCTTVDGRVHETKQPDARCVAPQKADEPYEDVDEDDVPVDAEETADINGDSPDHVVDVPEDFDEEDFDDIADTFESSYNFRFEEPYVHLKFTSLFPLIIK